MTDTTPGSPPAGDDGDGAGDTARAMRALSAELNTAGLAARLHDTSGVLDITATADQPGGKAIEIIIDEDLYVEIRYWNPPGATPEQVTNVIVRALAAIAAAQRP